MNRRFPHNVMANGKTPKVRESSVVAACLQMLQLRGIFAWRNNTGAVAATYKGKSRFIRYGHPGSADIFAIVAGGQFLAIECKTPLGPKGGGAKQSEDQVEFQQRVKGAGGVYLLVRSGQELEAYLDGASV